LVAFAIVHLINEKSYRLKARQRQSDKPLLDVDSGDLWLSKRRVEMLIGSEGRLRSILVFTADAKDLKSARLI
jgi:hypothetical protein